MFFKYSQSFRKRPPRKFEKVVITRAGSLNMRMSSCKRPHGKTIEGRASGLLGEL